MDFVGDDNVVRLMHAVHEPDFVVVQRHGAELHGGVIVGAFTVFVDAREIALAFFRFVVAVLLVAEKR